MFSKLQLKQLLCIPFILLSQTAAFGQEEINTFKRIHSNLLYAGLSFSVDGKTTSLYCTYIGNKRFGGTFSYETNIQDAYAAPEEYRTSILRDDMDKIKGISLRAATNIPLNTNIRFGFEAGFSYMKYQRTIINKETGYLIFFPITYTTIQHENYNTPGISIKSKLEFPYFNYIGFETALNMNINKYQSFFTLELCLTFGKVKRAAIDKSNILNRK